MERIEKMAAAAKELYKGVRQVERAELGAAEEDVAAFIVLELFMNTMKPLMEEGGGDDTD